jgi:hypothetical protein
MKKHLLAVGLLTWSAVACNSPLQPESGSVDAGRGPAPQQTRSLGIGETFVITPPLASALREFDDRERREQLRDWAVLGTVAYLGASAEQASASSYELPPIRLPFLDELYEFEYDRGRRLYLDGRVLLFRDRNDPDPQATLGRLADRVRMESGELPETVEVFVVDDDYGRGVLRVEFADRLRSAELFSAAYGYVEGDGRTEQTLADWLASVDDLSRVEVTDDGEVRLGGRRFARTRSANVTAQDVAALYQAHQQLSETPPEIKERRARLPPAAITASDHLAELQAEGSLDAESAQPHLLAIVSSIPRAEFPSGLEIGYETVLPALGMSLQQIVEDAVALRRRDARSPGFSLDPTLLPSPLDPKHPRFLDSLRGFVADPCRDLRSIARQGRQFEKIEPDPTRRTERAQAAINVKQNLPGPIGNPWCQALRERAAELADVVSKLAAADPSEWDAAMVGYHQIAARWQEDQASPTATATAMLSQIALDFHDADAKVQCARYEGLAGTEVGMTLFYTDLLAKLWKSVDYGLSAPVLAVPGFLTSPRIKLPAAFREQFKRIPSTRIWFGPRANSVARGADQGSRSLTFAHLFSRVYAAGSNPARPGAEEAPREDSRRSLGWWTRHFDDVADYEPQYHRQNQIMKWALVTAELRAAGAAQYLANTAVPRGATFADWQHAHRGELRFAEQLPVVHATAAGKECLPLLVSYSFESMGSEAAISGGVSTVARNAVRDVATLDLARPLGARKPFVADLGAGVSGSASRARAVRTGSSVTFANAEKAATVSAAGEVTLHSPSVHFKTGGTPRRLRVQLDGNGAPMGQLTLLPHGGHVQLTWISDFEKHEIDDTIEAAVGLGQADKLARAGHALEAVKGYEAYLHAAAHSADDEARRLLVDVARGRSEATLKQLAALEPLRESLSPKILQAVQRGLDETATPAVAHYIRQQLAGVEKSVTDHLDVSPRGLVLTRDIRLSHLPHLRHREVTNLSDHHVYVDGRILAAHEGFRPDVGGSAARWRQVPHIEMRALRIDPSAIPADRLRDSSGATFEYIAQGSESTDKDDVKTVIIIIVGGATVVGGAAVAADAAATDATPARTPARPTP